MNHHSAWLHRISARSAAVFVLFIVWSSETATAQQVGNMKGGDTGLQTRSLDALRQLEALPEQEYTIGDGDEIDIQVVNRPELSGHHLVGPDGRITLPLAGSFEIKNMTREAAARAIAATLERYYTSLDVTVGMLKYGSNRILVLGHVAQPGILYFENPPTLLEALTRSHATSPKATDSDSSIPKRCALFRGKDEVVWIDVKSMMEQGGATLRLRRDDVVYVPDEQDDLVTVLGEVQRPGVVKIEPTTTLLNVLAMSGGLTPNSGSARIEVVRQSNGTAREISFKDLLDPSKVSEISLQRGDVVYVQKSTMAKFEYAVDKLAPLGTILLFGSALIH